MDGVKNYFWWGREWETFEIKVSLLWYLSLFVYFSFLKACETCSSLIYYIKSPFNLQTKLYKYCCGRQRINCIYPHLKNTYHIYLLVISTRLLSILLKSSKCKQKNPWRGISLNSVRAIGRSYSMKTKCEWFGCKWREL